MPGDGGDRDPPVVWCATTEDMLAAGALIRCVRRRPGARACRARLVIKRIAYRAARSGPPITGVPCWRPHASPVETAPAIVHRRLSKPVFFSSRSDPRPWGQPAGHHQTTFVQSPYAYWKQLALERRPLIITLTVLALNIGAARIPRRREDSKMSETFQYPSVFRTPACLQTAAKARLRPPANGDRAQT